MPIGFVNLADALEAVSVDNPGFVNLATESETGKPDNPGFVNLADGTGSVPVSPPAFADLKTGTHKVVVPEGHVLLKADIAFQAETNPVLCVKTYSGLPSEETFLKVTKTPNSKTTGDYLFVPGSYVTLDGVGFALFKPLYFFVTAIAAGEISVGESVYSGPEGKVMGTPGAIGTNPGDENNPEGKYYIIGEAKTAAEKDGDLIQYWPSKPKLAP